MSEAMYDSLKKKNEEEEQKLDTKLKEVEDLNGETEVIKALIAKFMYLAKILDKVWCLFYCYAYAVLLRLYTNLRIVC
jgi:hypothetical protein